MEFVYVVKRYDLFDFDLSAPHGFVFLNDNEYAYHYIERIRTKGFFIERKHAERDCLFKQIIPYTVIVCGSEIFILQRSNSGVESRLRNKTTIGVGGHINPIDSCSCILRACVLRELHEELCLLEEFEPRIIGIVNDDSNLVGSVHFGLVYLLRLNDYCVTVREKDQLCGSFMPIEQVQTMIRNSNQFETWSMLIGKQLHKISAMR